MFYKNWPYWLKGGAWGLVFFILFYLIIGLSKLNLVLDFLNFFVAPGLMVAFFTGQVPIGMEEGTSGITLMGNILFHLVNGIFYFAIGSIIGLVYQKIKTKK